jgi:hypothetical protein
MPGLWAEVYFWVANPKPRATLGRSTIKEKEK